MAFTKAFLEEVKDRNNIEEIINKTVQLKRTGSVIRGLCPFHSEKTPSFTVFTSTQNYYCFGCGEGGDVVSFVMKTEGLDYPSAIEYLAKRAGIPMEEDFTSAMPSIKKERIVEAMREAGKFFYSCLIAEEGKIARDYLDKRQITNLTIKRFGLGYAPNSWDSLTKFMLSKGYTAEELRTAFLSGVSKKGSLFDIFRNRLVIPVFDLNNNPVAFSARRLNEADERKYVNTSDTPAFKKSKVLFGLNIAKNNSDGSVILCEGAIDAIMLHQAGFSNACATLGTAITNEHSRIIARIAKKAYLAYDIDKAGRSATAKAINYLNEAGVSTKVVNLGNDTKDPDEFIKKYGSEAFGRRLESSESQNEYTINSIISKYQIDIADEKSFAARELCSFLATIDNSTDRDIYTTFAASKLGISPKSLEEDINRIRKSNEKRSKSKQDQRLLGDIEGFGDKVNRERVKFSAAASIEEKILGIMLIRPDIAKEVVSLLNSESFVTAFNSKVFTAFEDDFKAGNRIDVSSAGFEQSEISLIVRMMAEREIASDNGKTVIEELINKLKRQKEIRDGDESIKENPSALADYISRLRNKNKK